MFELTDRDVFRLVEMFGSSDATFMQVRVGDVEVVLSRRDHDGPRSAGGAAVAAPPPSPSAPARPDHDAPAATSADGPAGAAAAGPGDTTAAGAAGPAGGQAPADLVTVTAPSLGTFYAAPRPDLPPYVEIGSAVDPDSTLGLIEAMKVFTGVSAGVSGSVVEILVGNGDFVEFGQPLVRLAPSAPEGAAA